MEGEEFVSDNDSIFGIFSQVIPHIDVGTTVSVSTYLLYIDLSQEWVAWLCYAIGKLQGGANCVL